MADTPAKVKTSPVKKIKITEPMIKMILDMLGVAGGRRLETIASKLSGSFGDLPCHFSANENMDIPGSQVRLKQKKAVYEQARQKQDGAYFKALLEWVKESFGDWARDQQGRIIGTQGGSRGTLIISYAGPDGYKFKTGLGNLRVQ